MKLHIFEPWRNLAGGHVRLSTELKTELHTSYLAGKEFLYFLGFLRLLCLRGYVVS
jgi:hypothetical protein